MFTGSGNSWAAFNNADSIGRKLWLVAVILTHSLIIQYIINIVTEWSVIQPHILWSATQIITRPVCHHESFQDWSEQTAVDRIECTWKKTKMRTLAALSHREHSAAGKQRGWHPPTNITLMVGNLKRLQVHITLSNLPTSAARPEIMYGQDNGYTCYALSQVICDLHVYL